MVEQQAAMATPGTHGAPAVKEFRSLSKPDQRRMLIKHIEDGRSDEEIGNIYGLSQWQIRNLRYRLGIKKDRGGNIHIEPIEGRAGVGGTMAADLLRSFSSGEDLFAMTMAGRMDSAEVARRLDGMRALFDSGDPEKQFEVRIHIVEAE